MSDHCILVLMRAARNEEVGSKSAGIRVYVPRLQSSLQASADSSSVFAPEVSASLCSTEVAEGSTPTRRDAARAPHQAIPAKLLSPPVTHAITSDTPAEHTRAVSPLTVVHLAMKSPSCQSSPPLRDVGGTVYYQPPLQLHAQIAPSDLLVHRLQSFLPPATRPSTRQSRSPEHMATDAVKIVCNGPALDRFPLSVQGGLTASQVKRAHTPAYEPRISGREREPLAHTWLVPNPIATGLTNSIFPAAFCCII